MRAPVLRPPTWEPEVRLDVDGLAVVAPLGELVVEDGTEGNPGADVTGCPATVGRPVPTGAGVRTLLGFVAVGGGVGAIVGGT